MIYVKHYQRIASIIVSPESGADYSNFFLFNNELTGNSVFNPILNNTVLVRVFFDVAFIPFMISLNQKDVFELAGAF